MRKNKTNIQVRYGETDQMGYVYHGNYASFFEIGRLDWLRNMGISYKEMEKKGIMLPVYSINIRYIHPAFYDDILTITTSVKKIPTAKIEFIYEIHNQKNELITTGATTLVFVNMETRKPTRCPEYILNAIE